jgi:hypothetical protein
MWDANSNPLFSVGFHGIGMQHFGIHEVLGNIPAGGSVGMAIYIFPCQCPGNN